MGQVVEQGASGELDLRLSKLEERVEALEKTVKATVDDVRQVLLDVRSVVSELENPINYVKELGIGELVSDLVKEHLKQLIAENRRIREFVSQRPKEAETKVESSPAPERPEEKAAQKDEPCAKAFVETRPVNAGSPIGFVECAGFLLRAFGRKGAETVLSRYSDAGWVSREVREAVSKAMSVRDSLKVPDERDAGIMEHIMALYFLKKLESSFDGVDAMMLQSLLSNFVDVEEGPKG